MPLLLALPMPLMTTATTMMMHHPHPITVLLVAAVVVGAMMTMNTMTMMPKMPIMKPTMMVPMMPIKVPLVMAPIFKRNTAMTRTMIIIHSLMPLFLLALQGVIIAMLLVVLPMPSMILSIAMVLVAVMMISCCCHVLMSPCNQMFLHQTLPHFLAPVAIQNGTPAWKSRGKTKGRIHQIVKMSVPLPTNVYLVLLAAVDPLPQSPICLNQLPSCLLMVPVSGQTIIGIPEGMACKELTHPKHCDTIFDNGCEGTQTVMTCKRCKWS